MTCPVVVFVEQKVPEPVDKLLSTLGKYMNIIKIHMKDTLERYSQICSQPDILVGDRHMTEQDFQHNSPTFFLVCDDATLVDNSLLFGVDHHPGFSERCPLEDVAYYCSSIHGGNMSVTSALEELTYQKKLTGVRL